MDADLAFAGALEQRRLILAKEVSPRELTELYLERIERTDERLHSFLTVTRERALRAAQAAEDTVMRGAPLGPLHGVPVSIKDTADTRAVRTTKGSLIFRNHVPDADALPVERILAAGAVMLGKTTASSPHGAIRRTIHHATPSDTKSPGCAPGVLRSAPCLRR